MEFTTYNATQQAHQGQTVTNDNTYECEPSVDVHFSCHNMNTKK